MVKPILYTLHLSPPCRAVELTAKALGLELEQKVINLVKGEHLTPEFVKINPQHTVPVLDDNGTIIPESHAIMIFLVSKYGKDDSLYPKDIIKQARVNAALHFETGVLFARMRFLFEPIIFRGSKEMPAEKVDFIQRSYQLLEDTLVDDYVCGSSLTIADFSCISTIATIMGVVPLEKEKFPKVHAWIDRLKTLPYYEEANGSGAVQLAQHVVSVVENKSGTMVKIVLYTAKLSPPGRAVELTAMALGLQVDIRPINLIAGDHLKPEFVKMNPQHTIPLIIDEDGTTVFESHAIIIYLSNKYGDGKLYPRDNKIQAKINAALHFESGVLFARLRFYVEPILYTDSSDTPQYKIDYLYKAYQLLNDTIVDDFIVGNSMTLADLSCIASIASMHAIFPADAGHYPNLVRWMNRMSKLPYYKEINQDGAEELAALYHKRLEENIRNQK
ncbi:uncharacterized protein LOC129741730 [Uranotaenia lowii]|uniref:uncharacterized protein LOC129741730 n=1 Tax=Uranotaenia lowii TaxID=190385 RepID=UPI002479C979|nr:uncharacterized protein LOC129741730 [Uranotaenia lowii]